MHPLAYDFFVTWAELKVKAKKSLPENARKAIRNQIERPGDAKLPHDRDEAPDDEGEHSMQRDQDRKPIKQAHEDVEAGIVDSERIGVPNDVPASVDNR